MNKKYIICLILAFSTVFTSTAAAGENSNWGLGFQQNGEQPKGNADSGYLKTYDAVYVGPADKKTIYLTFDAGYENGNMPSILDSLKKHNARATFFVVGHFVQANQELTRRLADEGHTVGNHTFHHPDMSKIADVDTFKKELTSLEELYKETTGKDMSRYYRPPQGKYSERNLAQAKELGYKTVFWSLAYVDWVKDKQPGRQQAFDKLIPRIHPGAIVLLHSTSKTNADILDELLTRYEEMGYRFGALDELYE
ncbi:MAG: polysaccharide deacetylase family protein [Clostridiales bacterium]|jgi:peptidoglycan-N-acetylmuramic acid deacetylase|nr:polysaccharide deacetylase family protein [Clostridiales bacterium]